MKKALTSVIVSIAMVASSVSAIAADTTSTSANSTSTPAVQTGPLSPGGPVVVSPAQGTVDDQLACGYDVYGICGPIVLLGVAGMAVGLAAILGAFSSNTHASTSTTGTH